MPNCVFAFLRDPALVTKLAKRYPSAVPPYDLMHDMGTGAEAAVIAFHDKDANNSWAAEALALIESIPAARQMAESLAKKRAADVAKAYFEHRPDLAIAALEPLAKHAQLGPFVKPMLDAIARKHPELAGNLARAKPKAKVSAHAPSALALPPQLKKSVTLLEWTKGMPQVLLPDGTALPDSAVQNLLLALHESTIEKPHSMRRLRRRRSASRRASANSRGRSSRRGSARAARRRKAGRSPRSVTSAAMTRRAGSRRSSARGPASRSTRAPSRVSPCSAPSAPTSRSCTSTASRRR